MDLNHFLGRFHLVIVHMPIGLLLLAVVMQFLNWKKRFEKLNIAIILSLFMGTGSAIFASVCGWFLGNEGGYDDDLLFSHRWAGIGLAVLGGFCWLLKKKIIKAGKVFITFMMVILGLLVFHTGHLGGNLTHGEDYLLQYAPDKLKAFFGVREESGFHVQQFSNPDSTYVFKDLILPGLKQKCANCHSEKNKKGGLVLTSKEGFLKGGDHDEIFVAGDALESEVFLRVTLPKKNEKYMPPKGEPFSYDQIRILEWWINEGASFEKSVGEYELPKDIEKLLSKIYGLETKASRFVETVDVLPLSDSILQMLEDQKFIVNRLAANNNLLEISPMSQVNKLTGDQIKALIQAKEQITWLNLGNVEILDKQLVAINNFPNLTRLRLEQTSVSDDGINLLDQLTHLESLNLYGTSISDKSVDAIIKMSALKKIFLWQTKVSPGGIEKLKAFRPDLEVITGLELSKRN